MLRDARNREMRLSKPVMFIKLLAFVAFAGFESTELRLTTDLETEMRPFHLKQQTVFKMKTFSLPLLIDLSVVLLLMEN